MEEEKPNYYNGYSICLNEWVLDKDIKNELGILLIISSLTAEKGYCYASNEYLSKIFNIPANSISIKIKKLEDKGYITIKYQKRGCEVISREIRLAKFQIDDIRKFKSTILENSKENNISINNTSMNNNISLSNNKLLSKDIYSTKQKFGEYHNVKLTKEEYEKLKNDYENIEELIKFLDEYIEMKGYKAKSHYLCIKKWVVDAVKEKHKKDFWEIEDE